MNASLTDTPPRPDSIADARRSPAAAGTSIFVSLRDLLSWPRLAMILSAALVAISTIFPYWELVLNAPQYPGGLKVTLFTHKMEGDVWEVDGLNHYIGMMPLGDAATFERGIAMYGIGLLVVLGLAAAVLRPRWTAWLALPIVAYPIIFFADLYFWLYKAGHDLDPTAALSSSIKPFTPAIFGRGVVGQFSTDAVFMLGFWLATAAAILALAAMVGRLRTRAPKVA